MKKEVNLPYFNHRGYKVPSKTNKSDISVLVLLCLISILIAGSAYVQIVEWLALLPYQPYPFIIALSLLIGVLYYIYKVESRYNDEK